MNKGNDYSMIERVFFLLGNPNITKKEYTKIFECSRSSYYRDKAFVRDRLFMYEVKRKKLL